MKKLTNYIFTALLLLITAGLQAQVVEVCAGDGTDSVTLSLAQYQYGNIQWQYSEDTLTWTDILGAHDTVFRCLPEQECYYRARIEYPNCPVDTTQVTHILFTPAANAGPDRILNEGYVTTLFGNKVEDGNTRCMWQVIEGDSPDLEDPTYRNSRFTGPDTLYKLTWTVANACGVSTDTVEIRYVHTVMYDAIAIVDTTDIILSDSAERASGIYRIVFSNPVPVIADSTILLGLVGKGFLRKVLWFNTSGDTCEMITSQASLADILLEGAISFETKLFPETDGQRSVSSGRYYTRAELLQDQRYLSGNWGAFFQESIYNNDRGISDFNIGDLELESGWSLKNVTPDWSDVVVIKEIYRKGLSVIVTTGFVGDLVLDFNLHAINGTIGFDHEFDILDDVIPPIPAGPVVLYPELSIAVNISGSLSGTLALDIPVRITKPLYLIAKVNLLDYLIPSIGDVVSDLLNNVTNESQDAIVEFFDVPSFLAYSTFEARFSVGPRIKVKVYDLVGPFLDFMPSLAYSICNSAGVNSFMSEKITSSNLLDFGLYLGVDIGMFDLAWTPHFTADWEKKSWVTPYRFGSLTNRNLSFTPQNAWISDPIRVQVFNQDDKPRGGNKVLFETGDGVVSATPSGAGSASVFATADVNGIAQIFWKPSGVNPTLKASVLDCEGNHIEGSPLWFYADNVCSNSTLALDVRDGHLSPSGYNGAYGYLFLEYSSDNINWSNTAPYPLVPGTTYFVKDNNGCIASTTYTVQEATPACNLTTNAYQNGLRVRFVVNNGTAPYHFYVDGVDQAPSGTTQRVLQYDFTTEGSHSLSVTDANGCTTSTLVNLTDGITPPTVVTIERYNTANQVYDAVMGAVTDNGGAEITERGIQWSLSSDMSNATMVASNSTAARYVCQITGVTPGTTYYARAYATNARGYTGYGNRIITLTVPGTTPGPGSVTSCGVASVRANETGGNGTITAVRDHQNNSYAVVQIGSQCWLKENMRCTTSPSTGANMVENPAVEANMSATVRRAYYYDNNPANAANGYGLLYNWPAAMDGSILPGTRGLCPEGWHVPTTNEWNTMFNAAVAEHQSGITPAPAFGSTDYEFEGTNTDIAQMLSDSSSDVLNELHNQLELAYQESLNTDWEMSIEEYNIYLAALNSTLGNATGFSALPAGIYQGGEFYQQYIMGQFWSSSIKDLEYAEVNVVALSYLMPGIMRNWDYAQNASSLRCVRDEEVELATTLCNVSSIRANETGSDGAITSVRDHENNSYAVVQIGSQCWLKENMRCTTSPSTGANIVENPAVLQNMSTSIPRAYYYDNNPANAANGYGLLYNWTAAMDESYVQGSRGICPEGWHIPTGGEVILMLSSVLSTYQPEVDPAPFFTSDNCLTNTAIAQFLSDNSYTTRMKLDSIVSQLIQDNNIDQETLEDWLAILNYPLLNVSGFSLLPTGSYHPYYEFYARGIAEGCWISQDLNASANHSYAMDLSIISSGVNIENITKDYGLSVRCVRDDETLSLPSSPQLNTTCTVSSIQNNEVGNDGVISEVRDHQNNSYEVVQIGSKCWLKENMRCTTSPTTGANIVVIPANSVVMSYVEPRAYYYLDDTASVNSYGLLYNWPAAMDGNTTPRARGICPAGWHLPSNDDWADLKSTTFNIYQSAQIPYPFSDGLDTVMSLSLMLTDYNDPYIHLLFEQHALVVKLAQICNQNGWTGLDDFYDGNQIANYQLFMDYLIGNPLINITQFSASPTGAYLSGFSLPYFSDLSGLSGISYWSSDTSDVWRYSGISNYRSCDAFSVRCIRDASSGTAPSPSTTSCGVSSVRANETGSNGTITEVRDHQNNSYAVVQIGNQCWLKENMRCTTSPSTGANMVQNPASGTSSTVRRAYYYDNNPANAANGYGLLYNWPAAMDGSTVEGSRGICPDGWHLPTDAEWTTMLNAAVAEHQPGVTPSPAFGSQGRALEGENTYIAQMLSDSSAETWSDAVSLIETVYQSGSGNISTDLYNQMMNNITNPLGNATGFSALPGGTLNSGNLSFVNRGVSNYFFSASRINDSVICRGLSYLLSGVTREKLLSTMAMSVRCVRNTGGGVAVTLPTVMTSAVSNITTNSASCGGDVTSDGGSPVTARGICWSTSHLPTLSDAHTIDGSGNGVFVSNMTGLSASTSYYVRAYATNSEGTAYGDEVYLIQNPCYGSFTVTDYDGNLYNTVMIGGQCWMRENLRTTHYADGTPIPIGDPAAGALDIIETLAYRLAPGNNENNVPQYGYRYNWYAMMNGASITDGFHGNVQGVCPSGWHMPSYQEWQQLITYVSGQSEYCCGSNSSIVKALAAAEGWNSSSTPCSPGYNASTNNATGFTAMPSGYLGGIGNGVNFWSSTADSYYDSGCYHFGMTYSSTAFLPFGNAGNYGNVYAFVRCVH